MRSRGGHRPDPRAEPDEAASTEPVSSEPPEAPAGPAHEPEPAAARDPVEHAPAREAPRPVVTSVDPRLDGLEPHLRAGDWRQVARALGPIGDAGKLPPNLGLLCAIANNESAGEEGAPGANELAIRCAAGLVGAKPDSALALVVAKRLLRRNPVAWRKRPAPSARISILIVIVALLVAGGIAWVLMSGVVKIYFNP